MKRCTGLALAAVVVLAAASEAWSGGRAEEMVRRDWYLRESLGAIRDWEAILERLEKEKAVEGGEAAPCLLVPDNGETVEWANPIPLALLPVEDRGRRVRARRVEGKEKVEVEQIGAEGKPKREKIALGDTAVGYQHPGGGGKDQWYHAYHRRFDRLTQFRPISGPLVIELVTPLDLGRGRGELAVGLRNTGDAPLKLVARLQVHLRQESRPCGEQMVELTGKARGRVKFPVELAAEGGALLVLSVEGAGERLWVPVLTHVEGVSAVLAGIEKILADAADSAATAELARLRQKAREFGEGGNAADGGSIGTREAWRELFAEASRLRDALLLGQVRFDALLFLKRKPYFSEQPFMDAHHLLNRPGGGVYRLSPVRPEGKVTAVVDSLGEGVYRDVCLDWDAKRLLFAFGNGSDNWDGRQSYHIYEARVDGAGLQQLTSGPKNDCEPFYLPNGQIGFTSDRGEHFVMCGGPRHSPNLYAIERDGSGMRRLSFNVFNDFTPSVMPDGRILYGRWEYNERSVTSLHKTFTMNPDGTMVAPHYGNATIRPNVVMFPRSVPESRQVMALFTAHHGQTHGPIGLIDVRRGVDGPEPITLLTPGVPVTGEKAEDSRYGWYSDPMPLSETVYLCSFTPTVVPWLERSWAIYVGDRHGNLALVYRDAEISCAEPVPVVARPRPHVRPEVAREGNGEEDGEATLLLADATIGLPGVARTAARYLRIVEDVPRVSVGRWGVIYTTGTEIYTVKRIRGTVPIEPDGSAHFVVPANRNVYFEVLDADQLEIQRMRSVVCLRPGERRTCIGCHESRLSAPPNLRAMAFGREPSRPVAPPWGTEVISFLRDVQPVLDAKCAGCHTQDRPTNRVILSADLSDQFNVAYEELLPYVANAKSFTWDRPEDVYPRAPYTFGSKVSRLTKILAEGHHGVELTEDERLRLVNWIDANGVYYDRYETAYGDERRIFTKQVRQPMEDVFGRRCESCHKEEQGQRKSWWLTLNWHDAQQSRALMAPLARSSGGWGRCGETVFTTRDDPDYRKLLAALTSLGETLKKRPREDLLSLQGAAPDHRVSRLP